MRSRLYTRSSPARFCPRKSAESGSGPQRSGKQRCRQKDFWRTRTRVISLGYDHPFFQQAFKELVGLLAAEFDGNPLIEFIDTFMYGFWGEGHTWPFGNNPFPDYLTAERTWINMLEVQLEHFKKNSSADQHATGLQPGG